MEDKDVLLELLKAKIQQQDNLMSYFFRTGTIFFVFSAVLVQQALLDTTSDEQQTSLLLVGLAGSFCLTLGVRFGFRSVASLEKQVNNLNRKLGSPLESGEADELRLSLRVWTVVSIASIAGWLILLSASS